MNSEPPDDSDRATNGVPVEPTSSSLGTKPGRRKDGRPYAECNTREDGSYAIGKYRPPKTTQFSSGDNRPRGRRPKGQRNFDKDWEEELGRTVQLTRDGRRMRVTAHRAQVMTALSLAAKGRERSQELVFRKASELAERKRSSQSQSDDAVIAEWYAQQMAPTALANATIVGDDDLTASDGPPPETEADQDPGPKNPEDR